MNLTAAVKGMNDMVAKNPDLWRKMSESFKTWPMLVGLHPVWIKGMKRGATVRDFLEQILRLGAKNPIPYDIYSKTKLDSPITQIAMELIGFINYHRTHQRDVMRNYPQLAWLRPSQPLTWFAKLELLQDYSKSTAKDWWALAQEVLGRWYPSPKLAEFFSDDCIDEPHRDTAARKHHRVLERLEKAFYSLGR